MWNLKSNGSRTLGVLLFCALCMSQIQCIKFLKGRQKPAPPMWNHQRNPEAGNSMNPGNRIGNGFNYGSNTSPRPPKYNSEVSDAYESDSNVLDGSSKTDAASSQYDSQTGSPSNAYGSYSKNGSPVTAASKHGAGGYGGSSGYGSGGYGSSSYGSGGYGNVKQEHPFGPDTLSFLSSLAPSLLLSSLLLPLAISTLLAASNTTLFGRKKRDVAEELYPLYDDSVEIDDFNADVQKAIVEKDSYVYKLVDSLQEKMDEKLSADQQRKTVASFFRDRSLLDPDNKCLERLACLNSVQWTMDDGTTSLKAVDRLRIALDTAKNDESFSSELKDRMSKGSSIGLVKAELCQKFDCEESDE